MPRQPKLPNRFESLYIKGAPALIIARAVFLFLCALRIFARDGVSCIIWRASYQVQSHHLQLSYVASNTTKLLAYVMPFSQWYCKFKWKIILCSMCYLKAFPTCKSLCAKGMLLLEKFHIWRVRGDYLALCLKVSDVEVGIFAVI